MAKKRKANQAISDAVPEAIKTQNAKGKETTITAASGRSRRLTVKPEALAILKALEPDDPTKPSNKAERNSGSAAVPAASAKIQAPDVPKSRSKVSDTSQAQGTTTTRKNSGRSVKAPHHEEGKEKMQQEDSDILDQAEHEGNEVNYWLMKAEPESRIVKGKDVKFSIDDLKAAKEPEAWDGVRNFVARNNMRAMKKGDLAFFYHSNCKVPGVVGTMQIVQEHSVDETAQNPDHPYFDAKSKADDPKWSVVHVEFREKFPEVITLKKLQKYSKNGGGLENLQTLKSTRLSVSKVSKKEWGFIIDLAKSDERATSDDDTSRLAQI